MNHLARLQEDWDKVVVLESDDDGSDGCAQFFICHRHRDVGGVGGSINFWPSTEGHLIIVAYRGDVRDGGEICFVLRWDPKMRKRLWSRDIHRVPPKRHGHGVIIAFNTMDRVVALSCETRIIFVDYDNGVLLFEPTLVGEDVPHLSFSHCGGFLALGSNSGKILLYRFSRHSPPALLEKLKHGVTTVRTYFTADGRAIVSTDDNGLTTIGTRNGSGLCRWSGSVRTMMDGRDLTMVRYWQYLEEDNILVGVRWTDGPKLIIFTDVVTGEVVRSIDFKPEDHRLFPRYGSGSVIGDTMLTSQAHGYTAIWDLRTGKVDQTFEWIRSELDEARVNSEASMLCFLTSDTTLILLDRICARRKKTFALYTPNYLLSASLSLDGNLMIASDGCGMTRVCLGAM